MPQTIKEDQPSIGDIVALLAAETDEGMAVDLRAHCKHASEVVDAKRAEQFAELLVEYLGDVPDAVEELETLVVLWLAHPKALAKSSASLSAEARRLAALYECKGDISNAQALLEVLSARDPDDKALDHELASLMQRTGNADRLVERYLRRSEEAMREGRRRDAVTWLREVLAIDRSRRDVARMIRDLQYEDADKRRAWRRRVRISALLFVALAIVLGALWRESWLQQRYSSIAPASESDLASMRERLDAIDDLITGNPLWMGAFQASGERAELRVSIAKVESVQLQEQMVTEAEIRRRLDESESNYVRGRSAIGSGDYTSGLKYYSAALEVAPADWDQRLRLEADVQAIGAWLQQNPGKNGPNQ